MVCTVTLVISDEPNSFRQGRNLTEMYLCNKIELFEEVGRTAPKICHKTSIKPSMCVEENL